MGKTTTLISFKVYSSDSFPAVGTCCLCPRKGAGGGLDSYLGMGVLLGI